MKSKEITICGKKVIMAYCYATEITFHSYTAKDFTAFINESFMQKNVSPKNVMYAILSAIIAYYEANGEDLPIVDHDLMYNATPEELKSAFFTLTELYKQWYQLPAGEQEKEVADDTKKKKGRKKNS